MLHARGFTLVELMVTVALAAILMAMAVPSIKDLLERQQIRSEAQRISALFSLARSHAITQNQAVIVFGEAVGGALNVDVYDDDGDATVAYEDGTNTYIERSPGSTTALIFDSNDVVSGDGAVRFDNRGRLNEAGAAWISICNPTETFGFVVGVNAIGRSQVREMADPETNC